IFLVFKDFLKIPYVKVLVGISDYVAIPNPVIDCHEVDVVFFEQFYDEVRIFASEHLPVDGLAIGKIISGGGIIRAEKYLSTGKQNRVAKEPVGEKNAVWFRVFAQPCHQVIFLIIHLYIAAITTWEEIDDASGNYNGDQH